ncbi:unnamed protein product [Closterium sp. NIES-54]
MARKRKGQSLNDCPKDLNDIPYIRWMNQQIANGRHPKGLSAPPAPNGQGSSAPSPRAGLSRVRRQPPRTGAIVRPVTEKFVDDDDEEDADEADSSDEENEEPEDTGMSPSDDEGDDDYGNDDAEEEVQPVTRPPKRIAPRASAADKGNGKAAAPPARQEPRKKRSAASVERGMWSDKESTIFAAALEPGLVQERQCIAEAVAQLDAALEAAAAPHAVDGGGATNVNVQAGMEVPSSSQPVTSTPTFTAPPPQIDATPKRAKVHETATMQAAKLVSATIKDCHGDAMARIEGLVREWMAQDLRLARERMTESAPPHVHRETTDFSPPPPRGESAPPPGRAAPDAVGGDAGDVNTVTPVDDDVEIWVRGAND